MPSRPWTSAIRAISRTRTFAPTAKRSASPDVRTGASRLATDPDVTKHGGDDAASDRPDRSNFSKVTVRLGTGTTCIDHLANPLGLPLISTIVARAGTAEQRAEG